MSASDRDAETDLPRPIVHEVPSAVSPYIRRIVADDAGPNTGNGSNTYLAGVDEIAIIDPGPDTDAHLDAVAGCGGDRIRWILLTHAHEDHHRGAARLKKRTGAEVCAFGGGGHPGIDRPLVDGETIDTTEFRLRVVHTPGHSLDHVCYLLEEERALFSGHLLVDGVAATMGADADIDAYLASVRSLGSIKRLRTIVPGYGHVITEPAAYLESVLDHHAALESRLVTLVGDAGSISTQDAASAILEGPADEENPGISVDATVVEAHLRHLADTGRVTSVSSEGPWSTA